MTRRTAAIAAVLVALVLAAGACSGDDSQPTPPAASPASVAKHRFIEKGDALCLGIQERLRRIGRRLDTIQRSSAPERERQRRLAAVFADQVDVIADFRTRLGDVQAPPGDEDAVERLLHELDQSAAALTRIRAALVDGRSKEASKLLPDYVTAVDEGNRLAREYGFEVCGAETG